MPSKRWWCIMFLAACFFGASWTQIGGFEVSQEPNKAHTARPVLTRVVPSTPAPPTKPPPLYTSIKRDRKVAVATFVHTAKSGTGMLGMMDNIVTMTHQVHRFQEQSKYQIELLALLSNVSRGLTPFFERLGWHVRYPELSIQANEIRNKQIADEVQRDGAIGIWEMVKLEAWRPSVIKLDVEMILLLDTDIHLRQVFDRVFEPPWMEANATMGFTQGAWDIEKVNGGYLVVRPDNRSEADYHAILEVMREGDFRSGTGWRGKVGWTYGGRTIQGLLPYHYLAGDGRGRATRMPRCYVNNMVNSDTCKKVTPEEVISNHFTGGCMKPWTCSGVGHPLCASFTDKWWEDTALAEKWAGASTPRPRCPGNRYQPMAFSLSFIPK